MYNILVGFLLGIIFSSVSILYLFFRLLAKKVDPLKENSKRQQHHHHNQNNKHNNHNNSNSTKKKSILFSSGSASSEPFDFAISKDTPPTSIETCKWINFITKRLLQEINHSQQFSQSLYHVLNSLASDDDSKPDFIGNLSFSDINIGSTTPEIGTIKLISPVNASVNVFEFDIIYSGDASVTASTELWLNWPQKHMACLPVKTKISLKQLTGNFVLYIPNHTNPMCTLYLKESPSLTMRMITKMGYETVLKEPGKLGQFLQNFIVKQLNQRLVSPNKIQFPLFSMLHPPVVNASLYPTSSSNNNHNNNNNSNSNNNSTSASSISTGGSMVKSTSSPTLSSISSKSSKHSSSGNNSNGSTSQNKQIKQRRQQQQQQSSQQLSPLVGTTPPNTSPTLTSQQQ
ncbi:hypothetical protein PPL_08511 [Heterostelium album PN500]|uniref:SMP-LTD domain-containing protein n=1 Tax=Heterostelium pallidum (strain ATCC 26659 / Pp 5 / PN500) TaxID=670386 RepID=D3BIE1_HETP5|nr:hypothetical protein PPL_08511 [Heterostelium album PN500]EFA79041.1 hypothetical protein PPL_08511 [Heterostelium album PN500]|eukprot:XP_020431164.1 hypothetical protein PPL_08511 [Heterostelium album PN500]